LSFLRCSSLRQWQEEYVPLSGVAVNFEPHNDAPFSVAANFLLDQPGVLECRFSPGMCVRTPEQVKKGSGRFKFVIAKTDGMHNEQLGGELQLDRGEATLLRCDELSRNGSPVGFQGVAVVVSPAEFDARGIRPDDAVMQRMSPRREALRLLHSYLRSLKKVGVDHAVSFGAPTAMREIVQRHILDLAVLAVSWQGVVGESDLGSVAAARLRTALDYITTHSSDPRLTIEKVARSQGISARYLRRLMEASGHSYVDLVNELRLQKAFAVLSAVDQTKRTILDVAMDVGFSDISYFNRLFRSRFRDTPSSVRAQNRKPC